MIRNILFYEIIYTVTHSLASDLRYYNNIVDDEELSFTGEPATGLLSSSDYLIRP